MLERVKLHDKEFVPMITAEQIADAVERIAAQLNRQYAGRTPVIVCVLNGAVLFMADLVRELQFDNEITFVRISSYKGTESTRVVNLLNGLDVDIAGRDVIIVEDIVETGGSMDFLMGMLAEQKPASLAMCTLFFKPHKCESHRTPDYVAFNIGNEFIVGYGLDYDQLGRNLKDVYVIDE